VDLGIIVSKEALELLKSIQSVEDLKEHKEQVLGIIEGSIVYMVDALKDILKKSLSPEKIAQEMGKIQESQIDNEQLNQEFELEMERISNISGADEYMESLTEEMEKRMEPHAEELAKLMAELMTGMMGGVMEGFGEMMNEAFDGELNEVIEIENKNEKDKKAEDEKEDE
jgi:hypothetical protein